MPEKEKDREHEGTDGVESDKASVPRDAKPEDYKNIPGNQT